MESGSRHMRTIAFLAAATALLGVPLIFSIQLADQFILPKSALFKLMAALLAWAGLGGMLLQGRLLRRRHRLDLAVLCLVLWTALITVTSVSPSDSWPVLSLTLAGAAFYFGLSIFLDREQREALLWMPVAAGALASLYAIFQHFGLDWIAWDHAEMVRERSIGTMANPDFLAGYLACVIPLALALAIGSRHPLARVGWSGAGLLMIGACLWTYSRGGWLALGVAALLFLFLPGREVWRQWGRRLAGLIVVAGLAAALAAVFLFFSSSGRVLVPKGDWFKQFYHLGHDSIATRVYLWDAAWRIMLAHPLTGTGPHTFNYAYTPYRDREPGFLRVRFNVPEHVHNLWLEMGAGGGIIALLLAVWLVVSAFVALLGNLSKLPAADRLRRSALVAALAAFAVHVGLLFETVPTVVLLWYILALAAAGEGEEPETITRITLPAGLAWVVILLGLLPIGLLAAGQVRALGAEMATKRSEEYRLRNNWQAAYQEAGRAISLSGGAAQSWSNRGHMLVEVSRRLSPAKSPRRLAVLRDAAGDFRRAVLARPANAYDWASLGGALALQAMVSGQGWEQAEQALNEALIRDPFNPYFRNDMGNLQRDRGRLESAEAWYLRSIEFTPNLGFVHSNLGMLYLGMGRIREARSELERARELDPLNGEALRALQRLTPP